MNKPIINEIINLQHFRLICFLHHYHKYNNNNHLLTLIKKNPPNKQWFKKNKGVECLFLSIFFFLLN